MNIGVVIAIVFGGLIIVSGSVWILISMVRKEQGASRQRKSKYRGTARTDINGDSGGGTGGGGHGCGGHGCGGHGCGI